MLGSFTELGGPAIFSIVSGNGSVVQLRGTNAARNEDLPGGIVTLFDLDTLKRLRVAVEWHMQQPSTSIPWLRVHAAPEMSIVLTASGDTKVPSVTAATSRVADTTNDDSDDETPPGLLSSSSDESDSEVAQPDDGSDDETPPGLMPPSSDESDSEVEQSDDGSDDETPPGLMSSSSDDSESDSEDDSEDDSGHISMATLRCCSQCGLWQDSFAFSKSQLRKKSRRKCAACIAMLVASRTVAGRTELLAQFESFATNYSADIKQVSAPALQEIVASVFLSEAKVREWLQRNGGEFKKTVTSFRDVKLWPGLPDWFREKLWALLERYQHVFSNGVDLPPALKTAPHVIELIPGAVPYVCREERYTPAKEEYLTKWAQHNLKTGLYERNPNAKWASRVHLAFKNGPRGAERELFEIRPVGDLVGVNERIKKLAPNLPLLVPETEKYGDCTHFVELDGAQAFNQCELEEKSREYCAVRTPIGILQPTRVIEGMKNAGTALQAAFTETLSTLPDEIRRQVSNYADDIAGGVAGEQNAPATLDKLYAMTEELLKVLDQNQITVKPTKARIGFPSATFGGYEIGRGVRSVAEKNVQPILEMQTPKDVSEVRRVLGIFVQMQNMVPNYTTIARPLTRLTGKKAWRWSTDEDTAFQTLRNLCAGRPSLSNPDYNRIQHLDVDASNDGWGAMLYHVTANDEKEAICYFSGAWDDAMRMRPIYYREAAALYRSLAKARYYIDANVHETVVHTDHMPLKWVKHSRRGPITEWVLEETAGMTYRIEYIAGEANTVADATSRAPVVQASRMSTGIERLFRELLARLPSGFQEHKTMWVWAEKDTTEVARMVQRWRSAGSPLLVKSPGVHMYTVSWDFAVVAPSGERAPLVCANLFESGRPFACLVPSDLVSWIPVKRASSQRDERLQLLLDGAQKIVSLDSSLTWIVGTLSTSCFCVGSERNSWERRS